MNNIKIGSNPKKYFGFNMKSFKEAELKLILDSREIFSILRKKYDETSWKELQDRYKNPSSPSVQDISEKLEKERSLMADRIFNSLDALADDANVLLSARSKEGKVTT